jgi:hypothetical protein
MLHLYNQGQQMINILMHIRPSLVNTAIAEIQQVDIDL